MSEPEDLVRAAHRAGVRDERLLAAIREIPRDRFVPATQAHLAYVDTPIPIPHDQVTTQPSLVAQMVAALGLAGHERVLEVGAGYGWQTALLGRLADEVWSVERWPDLAATAESGLAGQGITNAHVVVGDGSRGLPKHAPYDAVVVAAAFPAVPAPLVEQLAPGGRLVQPIGQGGAENVVLFMERDGRLVHERVVTGARFVRLVGEHGFADNESW